MKSFFFALLLFAGTAFAQEDNLIAVLTSNAPLKDKADACEELRRVGTRQAVPALASLLANEALSHRARSALETIPDPSVDAALRQALGQVPGPLLAGVIHSLGVRRDSQAVAPLAALLTGRDPEIAQAAARALGSIGGAAVTPLDAALSTDVPATRLAICEGLLRCVETMPGPEAAPRYDRILALPNLPTHLRLAAFRGAIRTRGPDGLPRLVEAIRTGQPVPVADAIRLSTDLAGTDVTRVLTALLAELPEEKQLLLLPALGLRGDATATPTLVELARRGPPNRRVAAIQSLGQIRSAPALPEVTALLGASEPTVAAAALASVCGWPGTEADAAVAGLLSSPNRAMRTAALSAVGQRRMTSALPALMSAAAETDTDVADAAFEALGELAGLSELPGVVDVLLRTPSLGTAENALNQICERLADPDACAERLLPGLNKARGEARLALLRTFATLGGPTALKALRAAIHDPEAAVRDAAWRALCEWPTPDALADLATMTRTGTEPVLRTLALRGQLRLIPLQPLPEAPRVAQIRELLPAIEELQEQRLALSALGQLPSPDSLALVVPYLNRDGLKDEAGVAAVAIAEKIAASHPAETAAALRLVKPKDEPLAQRVRQVQARLPAEAVEPGFTSLFNGRDLTGWDGKPGGWKVEDGCLTAESTMEKPCTAAHYLVWRGGQPADFELIAEFRLSGAGNSGIQLRSKALPDWDTSGYQADMSGDGGLVGFVYEHTRGLIAGRGERVRIGADGRREVEKLGDAAELLKVYRKEDWNTYRIVCRGPEITLFINGTLQCQFADHDAKLAAARGFIALQMHPGPPMKIQFRNLRLKEL